MFFLIKRYVDLCYRNQDVIDYKERLQLEKTIAGSFALLLLSMAVVVIPLGTYFALSAFFCALSAISAFLMIRIESGLGYSHKLRYLSDSAFIVGVFCFFGQIAIFVQQLFLGG